MTDEKHGKHVDGNSSSNNVDMKIVDGIFVVVAIPKEGCLNTNLVYFSEFGGEKRGLAMFQIADNTAYYHYECDAKNCKKGEVCLGKIQRNLLGVSIGDEIDVKRVQITNEGFKLARVDLTLLMAGEEGVVSKCKKMRIYRIEENENRKKAVQKCANVSRLMLKIKDILLAQEVLFTGEPIYIMDSDPNIIAIVSGLYIPHPIKILGAGDSSTVCKGRLHLVSVGSITPETKIKLAVTPLSKLKLTDVPVKTPLKLIEMDTNERIDLF